LVVRRKYRGPKAYRDGGRVLQDTPIAADAAPVTTDVPELAQPAPPPAAPPPPSDNDAVARAVAAQIRAEEMQRAAHRAQMQAANIEGLQTSHAAKGLEHEARQIAAEPKTLEERIAASPMSPRRQAFVLQNRELLDPMNERNVSFYYQQARELQLPPDSDEEDNHILSGLREELSQLERMKNQGPRARRSTGRRAPPRGHPVARRYNGRPAASRSSAAAGAQEEHARGSTTLARFAAVHVRRPAPRRSDAER
jgi:hypothetical protein